LGEQRVAHVVGVRLVADEKYFRRSVLGKLAAASGAAVELVERAASRATLTANGGMVIAGR